MEKCTLKCSSSIKKMEIYGTLFNWYETGTEGVHWSINKAISGFAKSASYDDLFIIEEDDYLEIYDPENLYKNGIHGVTSLDCTIQQKLFVITLPSHNESQILI